VDIDGCRGRENVARWYRQVADRPSANA
jgi:hypothetical protein